MNRIRPIRRLAAALAGLAAALAAFGATPAFASVPPPGRAGVPGPPLPQYPPRFKPSPPAACPAGRSP